MKDSSDYIKKSYSINLFVLSLIPLFITLVLGYFNVKASLFDMKESDRLKQNVYDLISEFYELYYLQNESFHSLAYIYDQKNQEELNELFEIKFPYMYHITKDSNTQIQNLRQNVLQKQISADATLESYSNLLSSFILNIIFGTDKYFSNIEIYTQVQNYKILLQLYENFALSHLYGARCLYDTQSKQEYLSQIKSLKQKKQILLLKFEQNLSSQSYEIFKSLIMSKEFTAFEKQMDAFLNNKKMVIDQKAFFENKEKLNDKLFEINNYMVGKIDTLADDLYAKSVKDLYIIIALSFLLSFFSFVFGFKLKNRILDKFEKNLQIINAKNKEIDTLLDQVDKYVIISQTDLKGKIIYATQAFCDISGYTKDELIGKSHNLVRHPDVPKEVFEDMWKTIQSGNTWEHEVLNKNKNGESYWVYAKISQNKDVQGNAIGYTSIRQDITEQKRVQALHNQVNNLLNNSNEGFISFEKNLLVKTGYSKESLRILNQDQLENKNIADLLFVQNENAKEVFTLGINNVFQTDDLYSKEVILSLLPKESQINNIIFTINYTLISADECMIILEDVTDKKMLEEKIEYENKIQKMIVVIATRKFEFLELKSDFERFLENLEDYIDEKLDVCKNFENISKVLHTFKGLFAQEELVNITHAIHDLETKIQEYSQRVDVCSQELIKIIKDSPLQSEFEKDLALIKKVLGDDFFDSKNMLSIDEKSFKDFEGRILNLLYKNEIKKDEFKSVVSLFLNLNQKSLKHLLDIYPKRVKNIAQRLKKEIHDFYIQGDPTITIQGSYIPFVQSLVHVFRNMIDHGIEDCEERINLGKDPLGKISCQIWEDKTSIYIEVKDDGRGIDLEKIKAKALENSLASKESLENMSQEEIYNLIFLKNFSTKENTDLLSGRGVGLNVIREELKNIDAQVQVSSKLKEGTTFLFKLQKKVESFLQNDDDENLAKAVFQSTKNFMDDNLEVSIDDIQTDIQYECSSYCSTIKLKSDLNVFATISVDEEMIKTFYNLFFPNGNEEETSGMYNDILDEVLNTILGLAINDFPPNYKSLELGTPISLESTVLNTLNKNNLSYAYKIVTKQGEINILIIFVKGTKW